jgi:hypothetical protein
MDNKPFRFGEDVLVKDEFLGTPEEIATHLRESGLPEEAIQAVLKGRAVEVRAEDTVFGRLATTKVFKPGMWDSRLWEHIVPIVMISMNREGSPLRVHKDASWKAEIFQHMLEGGRRRLSNFIFL